MQQFYTALINEPTLKDYPDTQHRLDSIGWVDQMQALISLQNCLYWLRDKMDFKYDSDDVAKAWWGWNEIPMDSTRATAPDSFDILAVVLPLNPDNWNYKYTFLDQHQKNYINEQVWNHIEGKKRIGLPHNYNYGHKVVAILQQEYFRDNNRSCKLSCTDTISIHDLTK